MKLRSLLFTVLCVVWGVTVCAENTPPSPTLARLKELHTELVAQIELIVADFSKTLIRRTVLDENLQHITAFWESTKKAGLRHGDVGDANNLIRHNFFLQEFLQATKQARLKLQFLTIDTTKSHDTVGINVGSCEHRRILGTVYAYLFGWLQRMVHTTVPQHAQETCTIDHATITALIRATARISFKCWWFTWKSRLSHRAFDVDLYAVAPNLADEYLLFMTEYEKASTTKDATNTEKLIAKAKELLGGYADKMSEIEQQPRSETLLPAITALRTLMLTITGAYQNLMLMQEALKVSETRHETDTEQLVHQFISNVYSGNWLTDMVKSRILQPIVTKYGPSILQMLLDNMKNSAVPAGAHTAENSTN
jgi:hypothetical protein